MTQPTTAFGVAGISMYMNQPVAPRAMAIWSPVIRYECRSLGGTYNNSSRHENGASTPMVYEVPSMGKLSINQLAYVVNTHVGSVLSRYIMELIPAIKIASRPSQPAASRSYVL